MDIENANKLVKYAKRHEVRVKPFAYLYEKGNAVGIGLKVGWVGCVSRVSDYILADINNHIPIHEQEEIKIKRIY